RARLQERPMDGLLRQRPPHEDDDPRGHLGSGAAVLNDPVSYGPGQGVTSTLQWSCGEASMSKASCTPSRSTCPVISGVTSTSPSPSARSDSANSVRSYAIEKRMSRSLARAQYGVIASPPHAPND